MVGRDGRGFSSRLNTDDQTCVSTWSRSPSGFTRVIIARLLWNISLIVFSLISF